MVFGAHQLVQPMMSAAEDEDEYDALPDEYADIDFDCIAELCTPSLAEEASSEYSYDELDDAILADVAAIEARATACTASAERALHPNGLPPSELKYIGIPPSPPLGPHCQPSDIQTSNSNAGASRVAGQ